MNPSYPEAAFELGKTYYDNHEYEQAIVWLNKVPTDDGSGGQAIFLRGMSEYNRGYLDRSYSAFSALLTRAPLTEVYNNLGVVDARRGRKAAATEYFSKAVAADPNDADYRFNLAVALFKNGDNQGAARQLRDEQRLRRRCGGQSLFGRRKSRNHRGGRQHLQEAGSRRNAYDAGSHRTDQAELQ